jgi:hypothetical protein
MLDTRPLTLAVLPPEPWVPVPEQHQDWRAIHSLKPINRSASISPGVGSSQSIRPGAPSSISLVRLRHGDQEEFDQEEISESDGSMQDPGTNPTGETKPTSQTSKPGPPYV